MTNSLFNSFDIFERPATPLAPRMDDPLRRRLESVSERGPATIVCEWLRLPGRDLDREAIQTHQSVANLVRAWTILLQEGLLDSQNLSGRTVIINLLSEEDLTVLRTHRTPLLLAQAWKQLYNHGLLSCIHSSEGSADRALLYQSSHPNLIVQYWLDLRHFGRTSIARLSQIEQCVLPNLSIHSLVVQINRWPAIDRARIDQNLALSQRALLRRRNDDLFSSLFQALTPLSQRDDEPERFCLSTELRNWFQDRNSKEIEKIRKDLPASLDLADQALLAEWLHRIPELGDPVPLEIEQRLDQILFTASENEDFRKNTFMPVIREGLAHCVDRIAYSFTMLEILWRSQYETLSEKEFAILLIGLYRIELVQRCAQERIKELSRGEEYSESVETRLAYLIGLKERLNLPISIGRMTFPRCAQITEDNLTTAHLFIAEQTNTLEQKCTILLSQEHWRHYLLRKDSFLKSIQDLEQRFQEEEARINPKAIEADQEYEALHAKKHEEQMLLYQEATRAILSQE